MKYKSTYKHKVQGFSLKCFSHLKHVFLFSFLTYGMCQLEVSISPKHIPHTPPSSLLQVWSFPVWLGQLSLCCDTFKYKKNISKSKTKSIKTVKACCTKLNYETQKNKTSTSAGGWSKGLTSWPVNPHSPQCQSGPPTFTRTPRRLASFPSPPQPHRDNFAHVPWQARLTPNPQQCTQTWITFLKN